MEALVFVRPPNVEEYEKLGASEFFALPRVDEFISLEVSRERQYFQIIALHHHTGKNAAIEIYAVQSEPPWAVKRKRTIGFGT